MWNDQIIKLFSVPNKLLDDALEGQKRSAFEKGQETPFGVPYLDIALHGVLKNDLVVIGAPSGAGKTELACHIAKNAAKAKKRTIYFALEAERNEIGMRICYQYAAAKFYSDSRHPGLDFTYANMRHDKLGDVGDTYIRQGLKQINDEISTLYPFYREGLSFTVDDFLGIMASLEGKADFVIIDHLNYFDLTAEQERSSEWRAYSEIIKLCRDFALNKSIPVVLISHIRKGDKRYKSIVPGLDDFFGSSDVTKIATKVISIAPAPKAVEEMPWHWPTYMRVCKDRINGSATRYVARCVYNARQNSYEPTLDLGALNQKEDEWKPLEHSQLPPWAKGRTKSFEDFALSKSNSTPQKWPMS